MHDKAPAIRELAKLGRLAFLTVALVALSAAIGSAVALFLWALERATETRFDQPWLIWLMPVAGFAMVWGYQRFGGALWWVDEEGARLRARALAGRKGPILPLIADLPDAGHALLERHVCIDTTASGGTAQLLAEVGAT